MSGRATRPAQWRSRMTFLLALAAAGVGLGNLWRFSYLSGEHGGGAFVVLYLLCLFGLAVPVLIAEVVIGAYGRAGPWFAMREAADRSLRSRRWEWVLLPASIAALITLSLYAVVAGWALDFAYSLQEGFFASASVANVADHYHGLLQDLPRQVGWQSLFIGVAMLVVWLGVRRGIGTLVWASVPLLLALLALLVSFALDNGDLPATKAFLFSAQLLDFTPESFRAALGHAFYTLGVGAAVGICYGAYAPERLPIGRTVVAVAVFDTLVSIAAGLALFPVLLAQNIVPVGGPGLLFIGVPYAFGNTMAGDLFGTLFFLAVALVALGTAVALLEVVASSLAQRLRWRRFTAVLLVGASCWALSLLAVESLASTAPGEQSLFLWLDRLAAELLLPFAALLITVFVGWRMRTELVRACLYRETDAFFSLWYLLLRYIAPLAIFALLVGALWF